MNEKPKYGIDGVYYVVGLTGGGLALLIAGVTGTATKTGALRIVSVIAGVAGAGALFVGLLGVRYVRRGKFELRDCLLNMVTWRGDERVLDVGTGAGLMAIGAAKRTVSGRVTGIDIWAADDLSNNSATRARNNATLEGVADRVETLDGDARELSYPNDTFDVITSTLCIHNIGQRDQMRAAIQEISRTLKPGGVAIISDLANTNDYVQWFSEFGLNVTGPTAMKSTFPPQKAVFAKKPL